MKIFKYILFFLFLLGCKKPDKTIQTKDLFKSFNYKTKDTFILNNSTFIDTTIVLSRAQKKALHLSEISPNDSLINKKAGIITLLNLSTSYHSLLIYYVKNKQVVPVLINYDSVYKPIDYLNPIIKTQRYSKNKAIPNHLKNMEINAYSIKTFNQSKNSTSFHHFLIGEKGNIIHDNKYKRPVDCVKEKMITDLRYLKTDSLKIINNSNDSVIIKPMGELIFIKSYENDSTKQAPRIAKVILDFEAYKDSLLVNKTFSDYGYIEETHFFNSAKNSSKYYVNEGIDLGGRYLHNLHDYTYSIDFKDFLEITRVNLNDYQDKIILKQTFEYDDLYSTSENVESGFEYDSSSRNTETDYDVKLKFDNGTIKTFKDSFYDGEAPFSTNHILVNSNNIKNSHLLFISRYEETFFDLYNKTNGKLIARFDGYPFQSPNAKRIIDCYVPPSYKDGTVLFSIYNQHKKRISFSFKTEFINWNIPKKQFFYWLSDNEFIIKVKEVERTYASEENAKYFYLKFNIKRQTF